MGETTRSLSFCSAAHHTSTLSPSHLLDLLAQLTPRHEVLKALHLLPRTAVKWILIMWHGQAEMAESNAKMAKMTQDSSRWPRWPNRIAGPSSRIGNFPDSIHCDTNSIIQPELLGCKIPTRSKSQSRIKCLTLIPSLENSQML